MRNKSGNMIGLYWFRLVYMIGLCYRFATNWTNFDLNDVFCLLNGFATNEYDEAFTDKNDEVKWNYNQQILVELRYQCPVSG